jgi:hypothetical protein
MHAASVCSEPGSNSPIGKFNPLISGVYILWLVQSLNPKVSKHVCLVFKEQPPRGEEIYSTSCFPALSSPFSDNLPRLRKNDTTSRNIALSADEVKNYLTCPGPTLYRQLLLKVAQRKAVVTIKSAGRQSAKKEARHLR